MSASDRRTLLLLAAMWGGSFVFIRVAAPAFGPIIMVELRVLLGGLLLAAYGLVTKSALGFRSHLGRYFVLGFLNSALPFMLVSTAELRVDASTTVLLNATSPLAGALVAAALLGDKLTLRKLLGIFVAFAGVVGLVGWSPIPHDRNTLLSIGACLLGASEVLAIDIDPIAVEVAKENRDLNKVEFEAVVGEGVLVYDRKWDVVVSNIISATLIRLARDVRQLIVDGGVWIISGVIQDNWPDVLEAAEKAGFRLTGHLEEDGWVAASFTC